MELDPVLKSGSAWRRREERRGATNAQSGEGKTLWISKYVEGRRRDPGVVLTDVFEERKEGRKVSMESDWVASRTSRLTFDQDQTVCRCLRDSCKKVRVTHLLIGESEEVDVELQGSQKGGSQRLVELERLVSTDVRPYREFRRDGANDRSLPSSRFSEQKDPSAVGNTSLLIPLEERGEERRSAREYEKKLSHRGRAQDSPLLPTQEILHISKQLHPNPSRQNHTFDALLPSSDLPPPTLVVLLPSVNRDPLGVLFGVEVLCSSNEVVESRSRRRSDGRLDGGGEGSREDGEETVEEGKERWKGQDSNLEARKSERERDSRISG